VFLGNCRTWVNGTHTPFTLMSTTPRTGVRLNVLPTVGGPGGGKTLVWNATLVATAWPFLLVATSRTLYTAFGSSPVTVAVTTWLAKSPPTACKGVDWTTEARLPYFGSRLNWNCAVVAEPFGFTMPVKAALVAVTVGAELRPTPCGREPTLIADALGGSSREK